MEMAQLTITIDGHQTIPNPLLKISLSIDDQIFNIDPTRPNTIQFDYDIAQIVEHKFTLSIDGKKDYLEQFYFGKLTQNIPELSYVVDTIQFNNIDVTNILQTHAKYYHDMNGDSEPIIENYTNWFGCDGQLVSNFKTPLFAWFIVDFEF
jgi:hypothetical protein